MHENEHVHVCVGLTSSSYARRATVMCVPPKEVHIYRFQHATGEPIAAEFAYAFVASAKVKP